MLELKNITFSYQAEPVLKHISISFQSGNIYGLVGLNGSGKSTLLNCIAGFLFPTSGELLWQNKPLDRRQVAILETNNFFYSYLTGREILSIFASKIPSFDENQWAKIMDLPLDSLVEEYSTGMKKKLALLCILKLDREIIILDEPYNGLDLESSWVLTNIIKVLKEKGKVVIITSHILDTLRGVCDAILWLKDTKIEKVYQPEAFAEIDRELKESHINQPDLSKIL
ncbi:ABC transporter ATP-binding protein [Flectobacillus major]|jgi:ABC-2 type transport system ATP-binding protein|uniref:ABC transporter ATP-binding protein n=1 Tax=Flectobacillus major TaxID=103 RepID=UPI000419F552|nr:ATP-binding cassette domain-containing protein [Flectobacillus major]